MASSGFKHPRIVRYRASLLPLTCTPGSASRKVAPKHGAMYLQPGRPKHFEAGHPLTPNDEQEFKTAFIRRNGYLQGMYQRESQLLTQIENLKRWVERLQKNVENPAQHRSVCLNVDILNH
jgi:hypothetical protein